MGTSMDTRFAPQYANLFMAKLEEDFLSTHTEQELIQFHKQFQDLHPTMNLKMSYSPTHIHFLDTTIHIRENTIQTNIYRKSTDKPSYLMYDSFHLDHMKHSIIYSQALRYNRICSDTTERNHHLKALKADFINRDYNPMIVDQYIHATTRIPRMVTYIPQLRTPRDLQGTLRKDKRLKSIFPDPPLLAFRQPPNLKSLITRSALLHPTKNGTYPCDKKQCKTCPHILISDKIPIPDTLEEYSIHGHYNCSSSNVVYLIQCTKCITGGLYRHGYIGGNLIVRPYGRTIRLRCAMSSGGIGRVKIKPDRSTKRADLSLICPH
ncbi:hypothetical protein XELAEV_18029172mg [Xenopus laevis]|uniref:Helix-turn-helix domain-containing protein n=1 Tax=Xenopus laevis TaxID=8355 RepID=A0A974CRN5_XENLA|nr:hypothetical protein XELAEV_18029172mg [Xenopus laevis]